MREDGRAVCLNLALKAVDQSAVFSEIASGRDYSCGLREDGGAISCWGDDTYGLTFPPQGAFVALAAGRRRACALDADGKAVCWGRGGNAAPPPDARFSAIAAGNSHFCGIAELGNLVCWGANRHGQSEPREGPFIALALGQEHTCALRTGGEAVCQGDDSLGQASPPPTAFAQIDAGVRQTCGITPEGGLECWGTRSVSDRSQEFAAVSVSRRICALNADGVAACRRAGESDENPLGGASLDFPMEMFPLPGGGVAVVEREGYIEIHSPEGGEPRTALDLSERTACCAGERGMLSAALDPDFDRYPFIYIYWQTRGDKGEIEGRVSRFPATSGGEILADGELVILRMPQSASIRHLGGAVRFGADGMLHLGLGEFAEAGDGIDKEAAADLSNLGGKIIRVDVRGATESAPYRVPPDNPFVGADGARPEIWAYGLRNPWRMSFAPNGDLIVADVGSSAKEELSIAPRGANLGWPLFEGSGCRLQDARCDRREDYAFPIHEYARGNGDCAIIGGMHAPDGKYVFGDYCSGRVWTLEETAPDAWSAGEAFQLPRLITAFGSDADGTVYALTRFGPPARVGE